MEKLTLKDFIAKEVDKVLEESLSKYKGKFDHLSDEDKKNLTNIVAESFLAGVNYGINKTKEIVTLH
jgi:hypothetical protein